MQQAIAEQPALHAYRAVVAMAHACDGAMDDARRLLDEGLASRFESPLDNSWTTAMNGWAVAAVLVGHRDAARVLRELLEPFHDRIVTTYVTLNSSIASTLGLLDHMLGDLDRADRWFH